MPYPLKFRKSYEEKLKLFPILLCHFIKRFAYSIINRCSQPLILPNVFYYQNLAMPAGHQQQQIRECYIVTDAGSESMPFQMINGDKRLI